jgi:phage-related protein
MSETWINDIDLGGAAYGFVLGADPNHRATPSFSDASTVLLGAIGPAWSGEPTQAAARRVVISGNVRQSSGAALLTAIEAIKQIASNGPVRLRFADRPDREFRDGRLVDFIAPSRSAILSNLASDLSVAFECDDPLMYDVNPQGIALNTSRQSLPVGTAPSYPLIILNGGGGTLTNPTITYRNSAGDSKETMGFTVALGANDYLVIDCIRVQVTLYTAGVASDGLSLWTSGDFFVFRAIDGYLELAQYPTLELSASAGTPFGIAQYCRAFL